MRAVSVLVALVVIVAACSDPRVSEDRAAACSNKLDDDADGLIDCDDPDCAATEACERTPATCNNGIDDDRDGTLDCRQESCRSLPSCRDAVLTPTCFLLPPGSAAGCPRGKGCYLTADGFRWCALEGTSLANDRCGDGDPSDRSQGCAAGHLCSERKRCARICADEYGCTKNSLCRPANTDVKLCSASCLPSLGALGGCDSGEECVAFQRREVALAAGGWAHECVPSGRVIAGTVDVGGVCADGVQGSPASEVCMPGLLCIPSPDGGKCRRVCGAPTDGFSGPDLVCAAGERCYAVLPFSAQAERFDESYAIGVCLLP